MIRQQVLFAALFFVLVFFPSSPQAAGGTANEDVLRGRVQEYLQARLENRWDAVYELFYADYKKKVSKEAFLNKRRGVVYGDYQVHSVSIAPDGMSAEVKVSSDFQMQGSAFGDSAEFQRWYIEDGLWFIEALTFEAMFQPSQPRKQPGS